MDTAFFSWQSDSPNKTNRNFIEDALKKALDQLKKDTTLDLANREIVFDKDTQKQPGQSEIVNTIFRKIDEASVYVADVTFTSQRPSGGHSPNPNVLIEYGRAIKSLGLGKTICVMNSSFGEASETSLPFNMRHITWPYQYCVNLDDDPIVVSAEKKKLISYLTRSIAEILRQPEEIEETSASQFETLADEAHAFRADDKPIGFSADPIFGGKPISLAKKPVIWLRLIPKFAQAKVWLEADLAKIIFTGGAKFIYDMHPSALRGADGYGLYAKNNDDENTALSAVFAFKSGEIWSTDAYLVEACARDGSGIPPLEPLLGECLDMLHAFVDKLGVSGPFRWVAGMTGISGHRLYDRRGQLGGFRGGNISTKDIILAKGDFDPVAGGAQCIEPFFIELWDACGLRR